MLKNIYLILRKFLLYGTVPKIVIEIIKTVLPILAEWKKKIFSFHCVCFTFDSFGYSFHSLYIDISRYPSYLKMFITLAFPSQMA